MRDNKPQCQAKGLCGIEVLREQKYGGNPGQDVSTGITKDCVIINFNIKPRACVILKVFRLFRVQKYGGK